MADEEPVDQKKLLEGICQLDCAKPKHGYEQCVKRISGDDTGSKHCTGQYFDYLACVGWPKAICKAQITGRLLIDY